MWVFIACKGTALQKLSLVRLSVVRARLRRGSRKGRKASETRTRLPFPLRGCGLACRELSPEPSRGWGWQFFRCMMSWGRKRKSAGLWSERLQHSAVESHMQKPPPESWTVRTKPPAFPTLWSFYKQDDFYERGIKISGKFYRWQ